MATINELMRAYYLHRSQGMMNFLNNLHRQYSQNKKISPKMAKDILEGGHQERLKYELKIHYAQTFRDVIAILSKSKFLTDHYTNFEKLYFDIHKVLYPIKGIGHLSIYDIALRIGYIRNPQIIPDKKIYIFRGAWVGINNLYVSNPSYFSKPASSFLNKNGKISEGVYDMAIFDSPLCDMPSMFLEDLLCVYHTQLKKITKIQYSQLQHVPFYYIEDHF
jgi:hypothetical protein